MLNQSLPENHATRIKDRPAWHESHNGLTWRDMPCQSPTAVTARKLAFALFRMGELDPEEERRKFAMNRANEGKRLSTYVAPIEVAVA